MAHTSAEHNCQAAYAERAGIPQVMLGASRIVTLQLCQAAHFSYSCQYMLHLRSRFLWPVDDAMLGLLTPAEASRKLCQLSSIRPVLTLLHAPRAITSMAAV